MRRADIIRHRFRLVHLRFDSAIRREFPGLVTLAFEIEGVTVEERSDELERFKTDSMRRLRERYQLESLKDVPPLRAYRDFFWRVGIDPTKTRPASEALLRRVIQGKELPRINTLVDSYNIASMEMMVPLAVFDASKLEGDLTMRMAVAGERFMGIGMAAEDILSGKEVVIQDGRGLVAIYPYRDADPSKVTTDTKGVNVLVCGVPGVPSELLDIATVISSEYIMKFCGGILH